ncbi:MAG: hypothetical protein WAL30_03745 [Candidatus Aquirickettsiella sp.]
MLSIEIRDALTIYDLKKGFWRRWLFGDAPAIKALRKLDAERANEFQVVQCFMRNMPKTSQASYQVYKAIFPSTMKEIDIKQVTGCLKMLYKSKLRTEGNFNAVIVNYDPYRLQTLVGLNEAQLLT